MPNPTSQDDKPAVVCVFCGSVEGKSPAHMETARELAHEFHKNGVHLVYGGGTNGLMGELARTLVKLSGPQVVHGVIPRALVKVEPGYDKDGDGDGDEEKKNGTTTTTTAGATSMTGTKTHERTLRDSTGSPTTTTVLEESEFGTTTIVADMHTRKRLMATKVLEGGPGSGFVSLAGGFGTIEEVMEMTTWNQLGIHRVGVVLLNVNGYWDGLLGWVRNAVAEGYISPENGKILVEAKDAREVWPKLREYKVSNGRMELNWGSS